MTVIIIFELKIKALLMLFTILFFMRINIAKFVYDFEAPYPPLKYEVSDGTSHW